MFILFLSLLFSISNSTTTTCFTHVFPGQGVLFVYTRLDSLVPFLSLPYKRRDSLLYMRGFGGTVSEQRQVVTTVFD